MTWVISTNNSKSFLANATSILKSNKNIKINKGGATINKLFEEYNFYRRKGIANFVIHKLKNNQKMWINTNYIKLVVVLT